MKKDTPIFRKATNKEERLVKEIFDYFLKESSSNPLNDYYLWSKEGKIIEVYAVPKETNRLLQKINRTIYFSGIPLGSISQNKFHLEIEGANIVLPFTDKIIEIKTEQFLYGKPIFVENIKRYESSFEKGDLLIIVGRNKLHYGIGISKISSKSIQDAKPNSIIIRESELKPRDRGWYLRHGN